MQFMHVLFILVVLYFWKGILFGDAYVLVVFPTTIKDKVRAIRSLEVSACDCDCVMCLYVSYLCD